MKNIITLWVGILFLFAMSALTAQEPIQQNAQEHSTQESGQPAPKTIIDDTSPPDDAKNNYGQSTDICPHLKIAGEDGEAKSIDPLQQCRMAVSAEKTTFWTRWQSWIGVLGLIGLAFTVHYTRGAAIYTKEALEIAKKTLEQDRAWITLYIDDTVIPGKVHPTLGTYFSFKWVNTGKTPAIKVRHRFGKTKAPRIPLGNMSRVARLDPDQFEMDEWIVQGTVGCNQVFSRIYEFSHEALLMLADPSIRVLIRMEIVYETVFEVAKKESGVVCEIRWDADRKILNVIPAGNNNITT